MQFFEEWQLVPDAPDFLHGAWALHLGTNHLLVVCDGHFGSGKCPILAFGLVEAFHSHNEALDTWAPDLAATQPKGKPFLKVANSAWAQSVRDYGTPLLHYCIISGDCCVEVLSEREPELRWVAPAAIDEMFASCLKLGGA